VAAPKGRPDRGSTEELGSAKNQELHDVVNTRKDCLKRLVRGEAAWLAWP
jgi:hypothetical protein